MARQHDRTTLVGFFPRREEARSALSELERSGVPESLVAVLRDGSAKQTMEAAGLLLTPGERELLLGALASGGIAIAVLAEQRLRRPVEAIFRRHNAQQISGSLPMAVDAAPSRLRPLETGRPHERVLTVPPLEVASAPTPDAFVYSEPAAYEPFREGIFELTESAEEAVLSKQQRVVEEIVLSKSTTTRTEQIQDSVRRTVVEAEAFDQGDPSQQFGATNRSATRDG